MEDIGFIYVESKDGDSKKIYIDDESGYQVEEAIKMYLFAPYTLNLDSPFDRMRFIIYAQLSNNRTPEIDIILKAKKVKLKFNNDKTIFLLEENKKMSQIKENRK